MAKKALVDHALAYRKISGLSGSVRPAAAMEQTLATRMLRLLTGFCDRQRGCVTAVSAYVSVLAQCARVRLEP